MAQAPAEPRDLDCSTKQDERIAHERNAAIRHAVLALKGDIPGGVEYVAQVMHSSVLYQARIAGIRL